MILWCQLSFQKLQNSCLNKKWVQTRSIRVLDNPVVNVCYQVTHNSQLVNILLWSRRLLVGHKGLFVLVDLLMVSWQLTFCHHVVAITVPTLWFGSRNKGKYLEALYSAKSQRTTSEIKTAIQIKQEIRYLNTKLKFLSTSEHLE